MVCLVSKELHAYFQQMVIASIDDRIFYVGPIACLSSAGSHTLGPGSHIICGRSDVQGGGSDL